MANGDLNPYEKLSVRDWSFWDLWIQKIFRNFASIKYQFMIAFYTVVVYGMFWAKAADGGPFITAVQGLAFLSGGFITLVGTRLVARTSLFESKEDLDTDR